MDVTNVGGRTGTRTVVLNVDDKDIDGKSERVTVQPGETVTVSFTYLERKVGNHTVRVDGLEVEFSVTKPVSLGVIIPLLLIFSLLVLGLSLLVYARARRGGAPAAGN